MKCSRPDASPPEGFLRIICPLHAADHRGDAWDTFGTYPAKTPEWVMVLVLSHYEHWRQGIACPCPCPCSTGCQCPVGSTRYLDGCARYHEFIANIGHIGLDKAWFRALETSIATSGGTGTMNDDIREALRRSLFVGKCGGRGEGDLLSLRLQAPQLPPTLVASASSVSAQQVEDSSSHDSAGLKRRRDASNVVALPAISHASITEMSSGSVAARVCETDLCDSASSLAGTAAAIAYTDDEKRIGCSILQICKSSAGFSVTLRKPLASKVTLQQPLSKLGSHQLPLLYAMLCRPDGLPEVIDLDVVRAAIAACSTEKPLAIPVAKHGVHGSVAFLAPRSGIMRSLDSGSCEDTAMPVALAKPPILYISSGSDDEADAVPEAGPPAWSVPDDPRCSYLYLPGVDAQTLRTAETVLLPRSRGTRLALPWAGWRETKIICNANIGYYCTAGGAQCLWDGEMLNDEVINTVLLIEMAELTRRAAATEQEASAADGDRVEAAADASLPHRVSSPAVAGSSSDRSGPRLSAAGAPDGAPRRIFIWDSLFLAHLLQVCPRS